ncbi:MAG: (2Fe-2S) ferredoxin domain-containing protein [Polyangiaceae bacterium]|nr:(2Fe-2S) ferredoxin domain-containing protein [Polyangiaceae bacterium]
MPRRERYLFVCANRRPDGAPRGSCAARGAVELHARLKALLEERGLAATEVRACTSSCLDVCWAGPVVAVFPEGTFYGRVTEADLPELVEALARGERLERLALGEDDFVEPAARRGAAG